MNKQTKAILNKIIYFIIISLTQIAVALEIGESNNTLLLSIVRDPSPNLIQIPERTQTGIRVEAVYKRNPQTNEIEINGAKVERYSIPVQNGLAVGELKTSKLFDLSKEKAEKIETLVRSPSLVASDTKDLLSTNETPASNKKVASRLYYAKKPSSTKSFFIGHRSSDAVTYVIRGVPDDQMSEPANKLSHFLNYCYEMENLLEEPLKWDNASRTLSRGTAIDFFYINPYK